MKKVISKLVLIPSAGKGHLGSTLQFANRLLNHASPDQLSVTIIIIPSSTETTATTATTTHENTSLVELIHLPILESPLSSDILKLIPEKFISAYTSCYIQHVKRAIADLISPERDNSVRLVGLVVDMFCTSMIDLAYEFNVPSYVFFTSSAGALGLLHYLETWQGPDGVSGSESETEVTVPSYVNSVPTSSLPTFAINKEGREAFGSYAKRFKETKGIFINTFMELESYAVESFRSLIGEGLYPPVFTVGPLVDVTGDDDQADKIMSWLDQQPDSSVVLLCFGSMGSFSNPSQIREIALGLERSGQRFLWSIRQAPPKGKYARPSDYDSYDQILPPGYLERIGDRGTICGWVPQVKVLAHPATGGFVSHCGWNSILESLWFGVPIVAWPLYAEQQTNAFQLVRDLGLAIELGLDYRIEVDTVVGADDIERAVKCVVGEDGEVRKRVKEMGEMSRRAMSEGGSSYVSYRHLIDNLLGIMQ